jgi:hypothetical protein
VEWKAYVPQEEAEDKAMSKTIAMEDVHSIGLEALKLVKDRLKEYGIELTDAQDDELYVPMCDVMEKLAGYPDYRSHN